MNKIIGITGVARSGKDTLFNALSEINTNIVFKRIALADELKRECDEFLKKNIGISAFTEEPKEKEIIRPFLVTYGTHVRRKLNQNCWIDRAQETMDKFNGVDCFVITDVRFPNEMDWIRNKGGKVLHISREGVLPANQEESDNDPHLMKNADVRIKIATFQSDYQNKVKQTVMRNRELKAI
tara:strand:+ start:1824 stop:2369 length:546 start_codon:yes stop_codon:yes gene_type:complete